MNKYRQISQQRKGFWIAFLVFIIGMIWFLSESWAIVWRSWSELGSYEHGLLIAVLAVITINHKLVLQEASLIAGDRRAIRAALMVGIFLASFTSQYFVSVNFESGGVIVLPIVLLLSVRVIAGRQSWEAAIYGAALLLTAMPIWEVAVAGLVDITVSTVSLGLAVINVLALVEGDLVHIPTGTFEISQGCSGLRFLLVSLSVTLFYSAIEDVELKRVIVASAFAMCAAMVANWIRVFLIVVSGYAFGMDTWIVQSHYVFGWLLFLSLLTLSWPVLRRITAT